MMKTKKEHFIFTVSKHLFLGALLAFFSTANCFAEGESRSSTGKRVEFTGEQPLRSDAQQEEWAKTTLSSRLGLYGENTLKVSTEKRELDKSKILIVEQTYRNLPIVGFESRLLLDEDERPAALLGRHYNFSPPSATEENISTAKALELSRHLSSTDYTSRMVYWTDSSNELSLSHEIEGIFLTSESKFDELRVYVDAQTGNILQRIHLKSHGKDRRVNDFDAACQELGIKIPLINLMSQSIESMAREKHSRREGDAPKNTNVDTAYELLGDGYDYIDQVFDMDSLDNNGMLLDMYLNVHFNEFMQFPQAQGPQCVGNIFNAYWTSLKQALYIPEEALGYTEIILHELGHGIISNGSNLEYLHQSGALNESIADTIGVSFRAWLELGNRSTQLPAELPREIWHIRSPDGISRDMANPSAVENAHATYPDHMDQYLRWPDSKDYGGVHYNSSIMNMGFYLLSEGGQHPRLKTGPSIEGIGIFKAAAIYTHSAAVLMGRRSNFEDARFAFALAAETLYGKNSKEWRSVHMSMDAIGISGSWAPIDTPPEEDPIEPPEDPVPTPDPQPKPPPMDTAEEEPKDSTTVAEDTSQTPAPDKKRQLLIFVLLAGSGLIICGFAMFKMRPQYGANENNPGYGAAAQQSSSIDLRDVRKSQPGENIAPHHALPVTPIKSSDTQVIYGYLQSLDQTQSLPLRKDHLFGSEGLVLGRSANLVHIQLDEKTISRRHARLRIRGAEIFVEDLNSSFGTKIGEKPLTPFEPEIISVGQVIYFSEYGYTLSIKRFS